MNKRIHVKRTGTIRFLTIGALGFCLFAASCGDLSLPMSWPGGGSAPRNDPVGPAQKLPSTKSQTSDQQNKAPINPNAQTPYRPPVQREPYRPPVFAQPAPRGEPLAPPPYNQTTSSPPSPAPAFPSRAPEPEPPAPRFDEPVPGAPAAQPARPSFEQYLNRPIPSVSADPETQPEMPPPPPMKTSGVRVALLLPLTGPNKNIGKAMLNAAQLALFSFSEKTFELLVHDTKGTPDGAIDAAQLAIGDGARLILGPLLSASVKAIANSARAANVSVISFTSDRSAVGEGVFTLGFIPSAEVRRVVRYARQRGVQNFAALAPGTLYGETVLQTFREAVEQSGGSIVRIDQYDPNARDFAPLIRDLADYENRRGALLEQRNRLKERDDELSQRALKRLEKLQTIGPVAFEALFLADGGKRLQSVAALLPFYDIDPAKVRMLGTGQWDEPGIGREPALIGGWFAAPPLTARANFAAQYRQVYARNPPRLATLAYDATALATVLARNTEGPKFSIKALTTPSGFVGRDGIFRLLPSGLPERGLAVLQVGPRTNKVINPPPESFSDAALN